MFGVSFCNVFATGGFDRTTRESPSHPFLRLGYHKLGSGFAKGLEGAFPFFVVLNALMPCNKNKLGPQELQQQMLSSSHRVVLRERCSSVPRSLDCTSPAILIHHFVYLLYNVVEYMCTFITELTVVKRPSVCVYVSPKTRHLMVAT